MTIQITCNSLDEFIALAQKLATKVPGAPEIVELVEDPEPAPVVEDAPIVPVVDEKFTVDDVTTAFRNLIDTKGREVAKTILTSFGVNKIREIPEDKYAEVINAAKGAM